MAADKGKQDFRTLLGRQPARVLLVDLGSSFYSDVGHDLCDVLENLFSLACNISGPSRIPFFSILTVAPGPELVLPLSYVRSNHVRIAAGINELRKKINLSLISNDQSGCVGLGLQEACSQYTRQVQSTFQNGGFCHQVEVVIATCQNPGIVQKQVESLMNSLDLEHLKRIQILPLAGLSYLPSSQDFVMNSQSSNLSSPTSASSHTAVSGVVEVVALEQDVLGLQNFFNSWLLDSATDCEHLHIILPQTSYGDSSLRIKCDLQETVLNPAQLPYFSQFTVHVDSSAVKMVFPSTSKAMGMTIPVYQLHVTSRIPLSALCDSIVFGMPIVAQPTRCWKIDWDELERNQQLFTTLCQSLLEKNEAMLAELQSESGKKVAGTKDQYEQLPTGHFVIIPAPNCSLLIKSIAVKELLLPLPSVAVGEEPTDECINIVNSSLDKLEVLDGYNPLFQTSDLYRCLKSRVSKSTVQRETKSAPRIHQGPFAGGDATSLDRPTQTTSHKPDKNSKRKLHNPYKDFIDLTDSIDPCLNFSPTSNSRPGISSWNQVTYSGGKKSRNKPPLSFPTSL